MLKRIGLFVVVALLAAGPAAAQDVDAQAALRAAADTMGEPLTDLENEALRYIADLTVDPAVRLDFPLERGDLQLLNNHMALHARSNFVDWPARERKRLLLRLWVNRREGEGRRLAPVFASRYNTGFRQGVAVSAAE